MRNYIVYDFETSGRKARFDQILQAGIIVYNESFQKLEEINLKSRVNPDTVPSINALRVNRLLISDILCEPKSYYQMTIEMYKIFSKFQNSFFVGFNSINFDEEFFRQTLWEHFIFPYITNTKGNSRLDILNFVTLVHAFRKDIIKVEKNSDGKITFKLESLAKVNSFASKNAHEAIADVETTMTLFELLKKKNQDFFQVFLDNSYPKKIEEKILREQVFTLHNYMFNSHRIYLVKFLLKHPVYKNQFIGFDLKYDTFDLVNLEYEELKEIFKNKSFFRKIKINKQPSIIHKSYSRKLSPYSEFSDEEIKIKCNQLENKQFLYNLNKILENESIDYDENQSQELKLEEETIYSQKLNYRDSLIMERFHDESWEKKWSFAEKFQDHRLRFFAARHIYRNSPEELPRKIFSFLHQKISDRLNSLNKQEYITIPAAMEEVDTISLELEEKESELELKKQIDQYNIYINFLNDYYSNSNPQPVMFGKVLSKKLFGI